MNYKKFFIQVTLCSVFYLDLLGQSNRYTFDHLTTDDGLSNGSVNAVVQDLKGFIWIGTTNGLNKYDANSVCVYKNKKLDTTSVADNFIHSLCVCKNGSFWVGTQSGLMLYCETNDNFIRINNRSSNPSSISDNKVNCLLEDKNQNLWVGTQNGLNLLLSKNPFVFYRIKEFPADKNEWFKNDINSILQDSAGNIWFTSSTGLSRLSFKNTNSYHVHHFPFKDIEGANIPNAVRAEITEDNKGILWVGLEFYGIQYFDIKKNRFLKKNECPYSPSTPTKDIRALHKMNNEIWIGTNRGVHVFDTNTTITTSFYNDADDPGAINDKLIQCIYRDNFGTVWLGGHFNGISYSNSRYSNFFPLFQHGQSGKAFLKTSNALIEDERHTLWIATGDHGLVHWEVNKGFIENFEYKTGSDDFLNRNNTRCLVSDGNKGIWVGTLHGLFYFDFKTKASSWYLNKNNSFHNANRIFAMEKDHHDNLWIGTSPGGLAKFNVKERVFYNYPVNRNDPTGAKFNDVTGLFVDAGDTLWIGSYFDLGYKIPGKDKFGYFPLNVRCIFQDRKKRIWAGCRNKGLALLKPSRDKFDIVFPDQTDPELDIFEIEEDKADNLWLATSNFLYRYNPENKSGLNYNQYDGLLSGNYTHKSLYKDQKGCFWLASDEGIVSFFPDSVRLNLQPPRMAFTKLMLFGKEVQMNGQNGILNTQINLAKELVFHYNQNVFSISFAALSFVHPGNNRYAYRLEGFDKSWNSITTPQATFINLPSGKYKLWIKGTNNNGIWSKDPISLNIRILPPAWESWWAYVLYAILFMALVFVGMKYLIDRLKLKRTLHLKQLEHQQRNVDNTMENNGYHANLIQNKYVGIEDTNRPDFLKETDPSSVNQEEKTNSIFLQKLLKIIEAHVHDSNFIIDTILPEIGMSESTLIRKLKASAGMTPGEMIRAVRLKKAVQLLKDKQMNISEISMAVGFEDPRYFSKIFRKQYGKTPSEFQKTINE